MSPRIQVEIEGVYYGNMTTASKNLRVAKTTIHSRCSSVEWPEWKYADYRVPETKKCCYCHKIKQLNEFYNSKSSRDGKDGKCIVCDKKLHKEWDTTPRIQKHRKNYLLKRNYGITLEYYNKLFDEQNGKCFICGKHQKDLNKPLNVDHCHSTNKIRGLLCSTCNSGLGHFKDSAELLKNALLYLNNNQNDA